jgi:two-component system cell cycle sensor histidine kinase/response regulator CckA
MLPKKILVVEDENLIAMEIQDRLKALGYSVPALIRSGEEAVQRVSQIKPDLVLMDIMLAGSIDGIETAKYIHKHYDIPIVFLTAHSDNETLERAKQCESYGYVIKPLKERELYAAIEIALSKHAMEKRLKAKERWLLTTLKSLGDAVITTNQKGAITFMNSIAVSLTGWEPSSTVGQDFQSVFHIVNENAKTNQENPITTVLKQGKSHESSNGTLLISKNGKEIPIDYNAAPIRDEHSSLKGVVLVFRNITERKELEKKVQLYQKSEAIETLARGVANDFNNNMTSIQLGIDLSLMEIDPDDPAFSGIQKHMKEIHQNAAHAADLARQLLMFSRKHPMNPKSLSINTLIKQSSSTLKQLTGQNIHISTVLEPDLWNTLADQVTIERVILNLVLNAREAMPSGGVLTIKTVNSEINEAMCQDMTNTRPGKFICLMIQDTGAGMKKETIEHIFEPFFSTKGPDKSKGLGLSVVDGIIKQHKGWITVETVVDQGTTFKVYLPALPKVSEKTEDVELKDIRTSGRGEKILVVEDEKGVREFLNKTLTHVGYSVFVAEDSKQAYEIFEREKGNIQLMLSDVVLPGINGVELAERLLALKPDLRILLCSGDTDDRCHWDEIEAKGYAFLDKPFNIAMLAHKVHEVMNN